MSAKKPTGGVATTRHFELPALDLKLGSLTEGTDIPPPPPSPKEAEKEEDEVMEDAVMEDLPPPPKTVAKKEEKVEDHQRPKKMETNGAANGTSPAVRPDMTINTNADLKRTAEEVPLSPVPSSRGSLRRFFGKASMNYAYDEQGSAIGHGSSRPPSRAASSILDAKKAKRSSGWFRRLRFLDHGDDSKSTIMPAVAPVATVATVPAAIKVEALKPRPNGPPAPKIELTTLKTKIDTRFGDDLFKGIGRDQ
ncbi:hypothetical protein GGR50DRAFT_475200 [Xylaria sp. CBS 124048]|nr:hypothetical protein GGR50DRAFT_475200 [Xylaria sp. CBS 124048]